MPSIRTGRPEAAPRVVVVLTDELVEPIDGWTSRREVDPPQVADMEDPEPEPVLEEDLPRRPFP